MTEAGLDEEAYATRIEDAFIAERGTPFLLSPKDWTLIRGWRDGGIPVDTVVRAVREAFERRRARGQAGKISSIAYCADAVEEAWEMERRGLVGKAAPPGAGADAPLKKEILASLAERLRSPSGPHAPGGAAEDLLRMVKEKAAAKIESLPLELPFEESEDKLSSVEASLVRSVLRILPPEQKDLVESRVASALGDVTGVSAHVVERMQRALTRREVRALLGLPRLTLLHG